MYVNEETWKWQIIMLTQMFNIMLKLKAGRLVVKSLNVPDGTYL